MNAIKKVLFVFIFIAILFLESAFFLQKYYIFISLKTQVPSLVLKEKVDAFLKCVRTPISSVMQDSPKSREILNIKEGIVFISGNATPGFLVLDVNGKILGKVLKSEKKLFYVATPFSKFFSMYVTVEGSPSYEGRIIGGTPPLLEVVEDINLDGREVWISTEEEYGYYLRKKGKGYLGKIKGKDIDLWIVDYTLPKGPFEVVGK